MHIHAGYKLLGLLFSRHNVGYDPRDAVSITGRPEALNTSDILYLAREHYALKAKRTRVKAERLDTLPFPVLLEWREGDFRLLLGADADGFLLHDGEKQDKIGLEELKQAYSGNALLIGKSELNSWENLDPDGRFDFSFFSVFSYFLSHKGPFAGVMAAAFFIQLFALVTPLFTMIIIDKVFSASGMSTLHVLIIGLFAIAVFDLVLSAFRKSILGYMTNKTDVILQAKLFRHLTHLPMSFFSGKMTGDVISRVKEMETVRNFVSSQAITLLIDMPFSIIFLIVMWLFNSLLTVIVVIAIIILIVLYGVLGPSLKKRVQQQNAVQTDNQSFLVEMLSNIETIKSSAIEKQVQRRWEDNVARHAKSAHATESVSGAIGQVAGFVSKVVVAITLWVGAIHVLEGNMTPGQLIAFNMLVGRVIAPIQRMTQLLQQYQQIKVAMKRIGEVFATPLEPAYKSRLTSMPKMTGAISFEQVGFRYSSSLPFCLSDINLRINAGEVVGVVGPSGSGKTTLVRLLQRLHIPEQGKIKVDGFDISQLDPVWLRSNVGVVQQDNLLLNLSVRENIAVAVPSAPMEQVVLAAKLAGADAFIRELPNGYDTLVGERGHALSTGQRQRVSIARALVTNPKVLIFDEATSMLDYEAEQELQKNMLDIVKGRTVFIIAHRLPTLRHATRILSMENGKIVEDGRPEELIAQNGRFAKLYNIQQEAFRLKGGAELTHA